MMNTFRSPVAHAAPLTNPIVDTKKMSNPPVQGVETVSLRTT
ncbi:MAG: hypothetical protein M5U34_27090 [Chloroflexi bacterium]|nr:hypothetical protein [Chloroflexota bacterium]